MINILLASHGPLAQAIKESVGMIVGSVENIKTFCLYENDDVSQFILEIEDNIDKINENILFVDFPGGTPAIKGLELLKKYSNLEVITGMNSMMIIECVLSSNVLEIETLCNTVIETGIASIIKLKYDYVEYDIDDL